MRKLIYRIKQELKTANHGAVYEDELARVWPHDGKQREAQIARFASDHGSAPAILPRPILRDL